MPKISFPLYSVWCLLFLGCASHRPLIEGAADDDGVFFMDGRVYGMPYHDTFELLKKRLDGLGYELSRVDRDTGVISTFPRPLERGEYRFCACRRLRAFHELGRKVRMTFVVERSGLEMTRVTVRSRFVIYWSDGFRTMERSCASTGKLEKAVLKLAES